MKILQINTTVNTGSTGRIAEGISRVIQQAGHESYIAFGRGTNKSTSATYKIGSKMEVLTHGAQTLLLDRHGFGSRSATIKLVHYLDQLQPELIHLHNLHGYYLHIGVLFEFVHNACIPLLWTLHDCWPFTGHCSHYQDISCEKWKTHCYSCPKTNKYPKAIIDNSYRNYEDKKRIFTSVNKSRLRFVVPSQWLKSEVSKSFIAHYPTEVINNGIDLELFKPQIRKKELPSPSKVILGVANFWQKSKGIYDFIELSKELTDDYVIKLVGLEKGNNFPMPDNIICIPKTQSINELAHIYSEAFVFVNPTYLDNFPTTNIEALACGTPVITYNTGGSSEAIDNDTGFVVEKGNIQGLWKAIQEVAERGKAYYQPLCRARADKRFNMEDRYQDYLRLYERMVAENNPSL